MRRLAVTLALLSWGAPARARGTCTVEGRAVLPFVVTVMPREAAPFRLRVGGVPAGITPGGIGGAATAHVKGPLAFEGAVDTLAVPARTRRVTDALNGLLRLAPATDKLVLHANVRATIVDAEVQLGGVTFRGLALPCDALTLDAVPDPPPVAAHDNPDAPRFVAAGKLIHFRGQPNGGAAMEAAVDEPAALELRESEASGAWVHVTSEWSDGTLLIGWVKRAELKPAGLEHEPLDRFVAGQAGCASGSPHRELSRTAVVDVKAGTQVFAARYLGPWARVVDGRKVTVSYLPKDDWLQLVRVANVAGASGDDVCDYPLESAWIPRAAAGALPADTAAAAPAPAETAPADGAKPAPPKPSADAKPADGAKPADAKSDAKPAATKPADAKPADAKSAAKPADAKPADAKPAAAKPAAAGKSAAAPPAK